MSLITDPPDLLTAAEVAAWLRIDIRTVYRYVKHGMPCYRRGRLLRFKRQEIEAWLQRPPDVMPVTSPRAVPAHVRHRASGPSVAEVHAQLNEVMR